MKYPEGSPQYGLRKTADKYGAAILYEIASYLFIGVIIQIVMLQLLGLFTGSDAIDISTDLGYAEYLLINSIVSYLPLTVMFPLLFRQELRETKFFPTYEKVPCETLIMFFAGGCLARLGSVATSYVSAFFNTLFNIPMPEMAFSDAISQNTVQFATFEFFSVIAAPICEELIYRHLLLRPLRKFGDLPAALISALIFGISHFNFDQFLYTFLFGFSLAVVAIRRNSVVPAIVIHAVNNLLAGLSVYQPETFGNETVDSAFTALSLISDMFGYLILFGGAVMLVIAALLHLFRFRQPEYMTNKEELRIIFGSPVVFFGIVGSLAVMFLLLY